MKIDPVDRKSHVMRIPVTEKSWREIKSKAENCNMTVSEYARRLLLGYSPKAFPSGDWLAMTREIKTLGNAVTQIARAADTNGSQFASDFNNLAEEIRVVMTSIERTVRDDGL